MSAAFDKLRSKLAELFQLDAAAELDFGIYRILNARRVEVEAFLDSLEPQVETILAEALQTGTSELKAELEKVEAGLRAGGFDEAMIATAPKVKELREKIATSGSDPTALTHDIFSHLTTFFSRYYKDGDFLSLRRYKRDTYAIPYEGEEVKLHWANADQYYIKSAENFRDYTFKLTPAEDAPRVTFKLVEADTQKDNTKPTAGQERRFVYQGVIEPETKNEEPGTKNLVLGFAYLPLGKDKKQADLNKQAIADILRDAAKGPFVALAAPDKTYTGKKKEGRTLLEKHLTDYTARNTFDYFIHKDLGGFLRRELDFYLKNEVLHLDDLDEAPEANWRETRARLKALRTLAGKVIRFLAQIEDFQKKLWLKKKFVTACDYVVTLDRIPEALYPEIAACEAQREEWVRLFAIEEIKADLGRTGYSVPLTVEFLKENQGLPVDTSHLPHRVKSQLKLEPSALSGAVVRSENLQALRLVHARYNEQIKVCYIDPPYNTGENDFAYKDSFQRSSWLALMFDRLIAGKQFLSNDGQMVVSIDDAELFRLLEVLDRTFCGDHLATLVWDRNRKNDAKFFSVGHEYMVVVARDKELLRANKIEFREPRDGLDDAKKLFAGLVKKHGNDWAEIKKAWLAWFETITVSDPRRRMMRYSKVGPRGPYRDDGNISWPGGNGPRFEILHPQTKKPVKIPSRGWMYGTPERFWEEYEKGVIIFGPSESTVPGIAPMMCSPSPQACFPWPLVVNRHLLSQMGLWTRPVAFTGNQMIAKVQALWQHSSTRLRPRTEHTVFAMRWRRSNICNRGQRSWRRTRPPIRLKKTRLQQYSAPSKPFRGLILCSPSIPVLHMETSKLAAWIAPSPWPPMCRQSWKKN